MPLTLWYTSKLWASWKLTCNCNVNCNRRDCSWELTSWVLLPGVCESVIYDILKATDHKLQFIIYDHWFHVCLFFNSLFWSIMLQIQMSYISVLNLHSKFYYANPVICIHSCRHQDPWPPRHWPQHWPQHWPRPIIRHCSCHQLVGSCHLQVTLLILHHALLTTFVLFI